MSQEKIIIKGARQHNLKNISVRIPRNKLVVITGLSGSGKSSLERAEAVKECAEKVGVEPNFHGIVGRAITKAVDKRAAMEELTVSIQQVSENAAMAEEQAREASEVAAGGGEAVNQTVEGMTRIKETVQKTARNINNN